MTGEQAVVPDPDVAAALSAEGLRATACSEISTLRPLAARRRTYRLDLASGGTIKARRFEDAGVAGRLFAVRRDLPDTFVPALARHGPVLFEAWSEGELLGHARPSDARLREAGTLLAALHATPSAEGRVALRLERTSSARDEAAHSLAAVAGAGAIEAAEASVLDRILTRTDPGAAAVGLTHLDYCGENMLVDASGRLRVFDNERIGIGPLGYDLARTWYRWDLEPQAWRVFEAAYAARLPGSDAVRTLDFWGIVAAARSAGVRLAAGRLLLDAPLRCLRRIARGGGCQGPA